MFKVGLQVVAARYAKVIADAKDVDKVKEDFEAIVKFMQDEKVKRFFRNPAIAWWVKIAVWEKVAEKNKIDPLLMRVISMMIKKQRLNLLEKVFELYEKFVNIKRGVVEAEVEVGYETSEELIEQLKNVLEKLLGKRVVLQVKKNDKLIAGIKVKVEDQVWEMSFNSALRKFEEDLIVGSF